MFHAYLVEVGQQAVGVVTRESEGYRFFAVKHSFRALEEEIFDSAEKARSAALDLHREADPPPSALTSLAVC
ncbi:MAG: hypothetical protein WB816_14545 [Methylocystis sp.]